MTFTVEQKVNGVVITSSPGPTPSTFNAKCKPAVAEFTPNEYLLPTYFLNAFSNSSVLGPVPHQPDFIVSTTSLISSFPEYGFPKTKNVLRIGLILYILQYIPVYPFVYRFSRCVQTMNL